MLSFKRQFLLFSGCYSVVAFLLGVILSATAQQLMNGYPQLLLIMNSIGALISTGLLITWIVMLVVLIFKKSFDFLLRLHQHFPKSSFYLQVIGGFSWFSFIIMGGLLIVLFYLVSTGMVSEEMGTTIVNMIDTANVFSWVLLVILLAWATYINFFYKKANKNQ